VNAEPLTSLDCMIETMLSGFETPV